MLKAQHIPLSENGCKSTFSYGHHTVCAEVGIIQSVSPI